MQNNSKDVSVINPSKIQYTSAWKSTFHSKFEKNFALLLESNNIPFELHPVGADFKVGKYIIFTNGCYYHGCPICKKAHHDLVNKYRPNYNYFNKEDIQWVKEQYVIAMSLNSPDYMHKLFLSLKVVRFYFKTLEHQKGDNILIIWEHNFKDSEFMNNIIDRLKEK